MEQRTAAAGELDEQRRDAAARTLRAWIAEHERLKVGGAEEPAPEWLDHLTAEALGLLVRLQVCRGLGMDAVAHGLARSLAGFAAQYEECAALPDAAEREFDAARAATFRELVALLGGGRPQPESPENRRN